MSELDNPILARVYKNTVQRVPSDFGQLNSNGSFLLVCGVIRKVFIWYGENSSDNDRSKAEEIAAEIVREDFASIGETESVFEGSEDLDVLESFLEQLFFKIDDYRRYAALRSNPIENNPITLSIIERRAGVDGELTLKPVSHSSVSAQGDVPPLAFISDLNRKSIAVLATGNLYDIWFAEAVSRREKAAVRGYITEMAMYKVPVKRRALESVLFEKSLCLVGQDKETVVFRHNFTKNTRASISSNMKTKPSLAHMKVPRTNVHSDACSDCVGDTLLRLFGISSKTANTGAFYKSSSSASDFALDDDDRSSVASTDSYGSDVTGSFWTTSPPVSSPGRSKSKSKTAQSSTSSSATTLRPTDALSLKILRLATKTDIQFLHQPRRNSHLLVLDLDHTLMDFSCRFDFMAEQLKRPYLDYFLSRAYQYYDIAVWSQTNFKWLELKLTELGMMDREDYKICFALDKSTMFTVKQQYVKPLKVIWHKCINQGWGPHNTVHVDDLDRNFELNKQCGILVSPFHLRGGPDAMSAPRSLPNISEMSMTDSQAKLMPSSEKVPNGDGAHRNGTTHHNGTVHHNGAVAKLAEADGVNPEAINDTELHMLARYLVHIAKTESDFTELDHSKWKAVANDLPDPA